MSHHLVETSELSEADEAILSLRLRNFNRAATRFDGPSGGYSVLIKDEAGETVGGISAHYGFGWMFVALLVVPEDLRGQGIGRELMQRAETHAREAGLHGIYVDTFSFQAPDFYKRLGFEEFGSLNDYPVGHSKLFLLKQL